MDEEKKSDAASQEITDAAEQDAPKGKLVTDEQILALQKEAHDSAFAEARRMFAKEKKKAKPAEVPKDDDAKADDPGAWRDQFYDATAGLVLTRDQLKIMRSAFKAALPEDPDTWVDEFTAAMGIGRPPQEAKEGQEMKVETKPRGKPASDAGSPSSHPVWEQPTDPLSWSKDDIDRILALKGQVDGRKFLRSKLTEHMRNVTVILPPGTPGKWS